MTNLIFLGSKITVDGNIRRTCSLKGSYDKPRQRIKKQRHQFADKGLYSQSYGFSSSHGYESWTITKTDHQRLEAFELRCWKRLKSSWDCKEIKPVNPKGNQP